MYICYDCEKLFYEPKTWTEKHGMEHPPYEHYLGCPSCGGSFTETYKCDCCGRWIIGPYIKTNNGDRICDGCFVDYDLGEE